MKLATYTILLVLFAVGVVMAANATHRPTGTAEAAPSPTSEVADTSQWDGLHRVTVDFYANGSTRIVGLVEKGGKWGNVNLGTQRDVWRHAVGQQVENEMTARWMPDAPSAAAATQMRCQTTVSVDDDKPLVQCNGGGCCTEDQIAQAAALRAKTHPREKVTRD
jgi:hypothetical protein